MGFLKELKNYLVFSCAGALISSCASETSEFYYANLGVGTPKIIVASNAAGEFALAMYDINGNFIRVLADYNPSNLAPRGLVALNEFEFLVSYDGTNIDGVNRFSILDGEDTYIQDVNLTGNIFQLRQNANNDTFVIETNNIESFDELGQRINNPRIATTTGSCVLATPRGMTFNAAGNLVVVGTGNDDILVYDVSNPAATTCVQSNGVFAGTVDPVAVLAHSDGFLYVATQGDDRIYRFAGDGSGAATIVFNNISFVNNPTALVEMPDGSLLIASDGTGTLVNISTAGLLIGSNYLVGDVFTDSVSDLIILQEEP
jgi:hypothetical protein